MVAPQESGYFVEAWTVGVVVPEVSCARDGGVRCIWEKVLLALLFAIGKL